jgi:hypothetical protein
MAEKPRQQFGRRIPAAPPPALPAKRSGHVALLLMGTFAIGGGAYALMPRGNCQPAAAGMPVPSAAECPQRGSSSGGYGGSSSRSGFYSGASSSPSASGTPPDSGSGGVRRGGFGSFAQAFTSHFSVGG